MYQIEATPYQGVIIKNINSNYYDLRLNDYVNLYLTKLYSEEDIENLSFLRYIPDITGRIIAFNEDGIKLDCSVRYISNIRDIKYDDILYLTKQERKKSNDND